MLTVTPLYAGLLAFLFIALSARVVKQRHTSAVSVGDGDDKELIKRMRAQANCAEYAPFGLLLLAMAELQGMSFWLTHLFGAMLFLGRVVHAYGFGSTPQIIQARKGGMYLTVGMILLVALANIGMSLF